MKLRELFKENISDKDIQRLKQDAAQIKAMKDSGNADLNKLMPMMKIWLTQRQELTWGANF